MEDLWRTRSRLSVARGNQLATVGVMATVQVTEITGPEQARSLAARLLDPHRRTSVIVVTHPGLTSSVVDVGDLALAVGARGDVVVLPSRHVDAFRAALGSAPAVWGDAVRVYPPVSTETGRLPRCEIVLPQGSQDDAHAAILAALPIPPRRTPASSAQADHGHPRVDIASTPDVDASGVHRVTTHEGVEALHALLLSPDRTDPVVVVTTPLGAAEPWIDADAIASELGVHAPVYLLPTGRLTRALSSTLGDMQGVYGGAGRVYSADRSWMDNPRQSHLRFAYDAKEGAAATEGLIGDALAQLATPHVVTSTAQPPRPASGTVASLIGESRALVTLDDGGAAAIWAETIPGVYRIEQLVRPGQLVRGDLELATRRLDIRAHLRTATDALADYTPGRVVLARVTHVQPDAMRVQLWPTLEVEVAAQDVTGNALDDLEDLVTAGEVLPVRILATGDECTHHGWRLSLLDVDPDDDPDLTPPSLLHEGPPWLPMSTEATAQPSAAAQLPPAPITTPTVRAASPAVEEEPPVAGPAGHVEKTEALLEWISDVDAENDALRRDLQAAHAREYALTRQIESLRTANRKARTRKGKRSGDDPTQQAHGFDDPEQQWRWEVQKAWVEQTPAGDKGEHPLAPRWLIGPDFLDSVQTLQGISRERIVKVTMWVLSGRPPRETHQMRTRPQGGAPPLVRDDGAKAMRAPLQTATASARRLHYWALPDGVIELAHVGVHDDFTT